MPRADASKTFYDPAKKRQILWGWVAEEGSAPHAGEDWSSIQSLPREVRIDPTNETRLMFPAIPELEALRGKIPPKSQELCRRPSLCADALALLGLLRQELRLPCAALVKRTVSARLWPSLAAVCDGSHRTVLR